MACRFDAEGANLMRFTRCFALAAVGTAVVAGVGLTALVPALAAPQGHPTFIGSFHHTKLIVSTIPGNGDVNPYGVAVVGSSQGKLHRGDVLVSNFNNKKNLQGTGSTIVEISPSGHRTMFAHISKNGLPGACPGGIGLSTALAIIHNWVFVGSVPSTNGQAATSKAGCIIVLDSNGQVHETISGHGINGPWDATAVTTGHGDFLFVANVLNGTVAAKGKVVHKGTVLRLGLSFYLNYPPYLASVTKVGSGFSEQTNMTTFVVGPTGLGVGRHGSLYVADTGQNRITMISHATSRSTSAGVGIVVTHGGLLNAPLGLTVAPNGDVLTVNGGNGKIVETTPGGKQVASHLLDSTGSPPGNGALFGLGVAPQGKGVYYVDDAANTLRLFF
jgi:hypothetical protein